MKTLLDNRDLISVAVTLLVLITVLLTSCDNNTNNLESEKTGDEIFGLSVREVEMEGCQYYVLFGTKKVAITHKGNCTNH